MLADILPRIAAETQGPQHAYRPRPSLAGPERCVRSLVYDARKIPATPFPGRAVMIFDDSSWHEELTADWIRKTAYVLHSEQMAVSTPAGEGHIDGILTDLLGVDRLWEHKGLNHFSFERIWKGQWPVDYFTQCALYLHGLHAIQPNLTEALLLIKNKNTAAFLECLLQYDAADDVLRLLSVVRSDGQRSDPKDIQWSGIVASAVQKFADVESHRAAATLPDRPFSFGTDYPCGYCRWGSTCWEGYEEEFKALEEDPALDKELEDMAAYYLEVSGHASEMEKEKKQLRDKVRAALAAKNVKGGKAGPYTIQVSLQSREGLDEEQIPPDILARAKTLSSFEVLHIRKPKEKGQK